MGKIRQKATFAVVFWYSNSMYDITINYSPLPDEGDPISLIKSEQTILVPQNTKTDPVGFAQECVARCANKKVVVLVPGQKFDVYNTRHGRGGGWYDRFLANVPREWYRIGVCTKSQFSKQKLERKEWDQEMDEVVVL